jgi:replication factor C subunit 1
MSDIRKWFMKAHEKGNGSAPKSTSSKAGPVKNAAETAPIKSEQVRFLLLYICSV